MSERPQGRWRYLGASVRGPAHASLRLPNQDAWSGRRLGCCSLVVVCDGLGSRPHSDIGARAACRVTAEAVRRWAGSDGAPVDLLLRLIHVLWGIAVHHHGSDACATTCLFAAGFESGRLLAAQLGDGLVLLHRPGEHLLSLGGRQDDFSNETTGLGIAHAVTDWRVHDDPSAPIGSTALLATDGVADDLLPGSLDGFLGFVKTEYCPGTPSLRWRRLARDLSDWPTACHRDDKTLALLWSTGKEPSEERA